MYVSLVGLNHSTTPVTIREKVAVGVEQLQDCLSLLHHYVPYGIILPTCNRTEVYTTSSDGKLGVEASIKFLKAHSDIPDVSLLRYVYIHQGEAVVEQLFKVACGLDSMVVGEYKALGQIGQALEAAERVKMVNLPLRHIFRSAIRLGRQVREETGISKNATSVSEEIIAAEVAKFTFWGQALEVSSLVSALMRKAEDVRCTQLNKTLKKLRPLSDEEQDSLEAMTKSIVTKILQDPIRHLKTNGSSNDYAEIVSELFHLDREKRG